MRRSANTAHHPGHTQGETIWQLAEQPHVLLAAFESPALAAIVVSSAADVTPARSGSTISFKP